MNVNTLDVMCGLKPYCVYLIDIGPLPVALGRWASPGLSRLALPARDSGCVALGLPHRLGIRLG